MWSGYILRLCKDGHRQENQHYFMLYRLIEGRPTEMVAKGSLGRIAIYLWRAWYRTQNEIAKKKKADQLFEEFSKPLVKEKV